jgi:hypothetical protein
MPACLDARFYFHFVRKMRLRFCRGCWRDIPPSWFSIPTSQAQRRNTLCCFNGPETRSPKYATSATRPISSMTPNMFPDDDLLGRVNAVNLEHVLGDIQTDRGNLHVVGSPHVIRLRRTTLWHFAGAAHSVESVALFNRRLPANFRYAALAIEIVRRCNLSLRARRPRVATFNEGCSLSEHTHPLRSVHANRASGATS